MEGSTAAEVSALAAAAAAAETVFREHALAQGDTDRAHPPRPKERDGGSGGAGEPEPPSTPAPVIAPPPTSVLLPAPAPAPAPPPRTACPSTQEERLRTGQVERVGSRWALVAFLERGRTRLCAFPRGAVSVNGTLLPAAQPLHALFERGMPLTFCPEPASAWHARAHAAGDAQGTACAVCPPCSLVTFSVRIEECVRCPGRLLAGVVATLGATGGAARVQVAGESVRVTFARRALCLDAPPVLALDDCWNESPCPSAPSGAASGSAAAAAASAAAVATQPLTSLLREGWPVLVRLEGPPPLPDAQAAPRPDASAHVLRAATVFACGSPDAREELRRRYLTPDPPPPPPSPSGEPEEPSAGADAEGGAGGAPARVSRVGAGGVAVWLAADSAAAQAVGAPREMAVDASRIWVNGERAAPERVAALRPGWPVRVRARAQGGRLVAYAIAVTDDEVLGERQRVEAVVVEVSDVAGAAEFSLWGGRERAVFYRRAVRMRDDPASGSARVTTAPTADGNTAKRPGGKVAALCELLRKGQRVHLSLTLSCSAPGFSFKAVSVEPIPEVPAAALCVPASTSSVPTPHASPSTPPTRAKKARKKQQEQHQSLPAQSHAAADTMGQAFSDRRGASPNVQTRRRAVVATEATRAPSAEPVRPGMPLGQEPKTLTAKVGVARRGRVINVSPDVALLSVQTPVRHGSDEAAVPVVAALASKMHLYGVPLMNVNLTTVLSKGQELEEVHLLPSDEKCLSKFSSSSAAKANPLLQNTEIVSAVWLGPAHFESPSLQFAELTKYCRVHKVPETTRHILTLRLGQLLGEDGRKPIKTSSDGELEAVEGSYKNKSENNKLKSPLAVLDEGMLLAQIKDMGPEKFLCVQLKQLMHSVLKDSVRSTQEFFLSSLKENLGGTELYNTMAAQTPAIMDATLREFLQEQLLQEGVADGGTVCAPTSNVAASEVNVNASAESTTALVARSPPTTAYAATAAASAAIVPPTMQPLPEAVTSGVSGQSSAASVSAALHLGIHAAPSVTVEDASDGALGVVNDWTDVRDKDLKGKSEQRGAAGSPDVTCLLLRGVKEVLQAAKKGLKASSDVPLCAMQEPVKKPSKIEVADQLTGSSAVSETTSRESKSEASEVKPVLDVPDTGEPDKRDFQKTLCAELQKHAKELAIFRDEACSLIENWKSQDSPPATPEELEFLQELSSLLDNKVEDNGKAGKNEEDTSLVAQQLIKFWNTANFPLTPVAQRGLQRLQELFGAPNKKMQGNEKECLGSGGDGLVEVEAALKEVREAFRDVKHVFEVQRCFRDLRECFRDVRRAYKGREPKPRALPPCADAPACAAAAAAAANTIVDVVAPVSVQEKPQASALPPDSSADVYGATGVGEGERTGAEVETKAGKGADAEVEAEATGKPTTAPDEPASKDCPNAQSHENSKVEVSSKSSQTIASMDTSVSPLSTNTSERAVQTVSTGPVLALNLIHDE